MKLWVDFEEVIQLHVSAFRIIQSSQKFPTTLFTVILETRL